LATTCTAASPIGVVGGFVGVVVGDVVAASPHDAATQVPTRRGRRRVADRTFMVRAPILSDQRLPLRSGIT